MLVGQYRLAGLGLVEGPPIIGIVWEILKSPGLWTNLRDIFVDQYLKDLPVIDNEDKSQWWTTGDADLIEGPYLQLWKSWHEPSNNVSKL